MRTIIAINAVPIAAMARLKTISIMVSRQVILVKEKAPRGQGKLFSRVTRETVTRCRRPAKRCFTLPSARGHHRPSRARRIAGLSRSQVRGHDLRGWRQGDEYRREPEPGFAPDEEEREYARLYGLDLAQLAWRRNKIGELKDAALFKQEYPATAAEAFQMSGHDSYIPAALVAKARKASCEASGALVIGFDPAWTGGDRHSMAWRQGRKVIKVESKVNIDTMEAAGWAKRVIDTDKPKKMFVDVGGVGAGVYDRLKEWGEPYASIVVAVNFGSSPMEPPPLDEHGKPSGGPLNRRAEMWMKSKEWLDEPAGAAIPDLDTLQADACGPSYKYDSNTRLVLERKEDMRRRQVPSPDEWDAVALTFAEPVNPVSNFHKKIEYPKLSIA
jgi:hypothetical protein